MIRLLFFLWKERRKNNTWFIIFSFTSRQPPTLKLINMWSTCLCVKNGDITKTRATFSYSFFEQNNNKLNASSAEERGSFHSPPLKVASPLAWLLATPPNGELARRLEKVTKARQGGGGGVAIMIYSLWSIYYDLDKWERFFHDTCDTAQKLTVKYCLSTYVLEKCLWMPLFLLNAPK